LSEEEWQEKDRKFDLMMRKKGYIIKTMVEDGSCLFRAVADQIYGDQEMHSSVRNYCMDYIVSCRY
jgi:OTU domain-containing protein 5